MYYNRAWPTSDHVIPYKLFFLLCTVIESLEAGDELLLARGVALGYSMARDGKNITVNMVKKALIQRAFPEVTGG